MKEQARSPVAIVDLFIPGTSCMFCWAQRIVLPVLLRFSWYPWRLTPCLLSSFLHYCPWLLSMGSWYCLSLSVLRSLLSIHPTLLMGDPTLPYFQPPHFDPPPIPSYSSRRVHSETPIYTPALFSLGHGTSLNHIIIHMHTSACICTLMDTHAYICMQMHVHYPTLGWLCMHMHV